MALAADRTKADITLLVPDIDADSANDFTPATGVVPATTLTFDLGYMQCSTLETPVALPADITFHIPGNHLAMGLAWLEDTDVVVVTPEGLYRWAGGLDAGDPDQTEEFDPPIPYLENTDYTFSLSMADADNLTLAVTRGSVAIDSITMNVTDVLGGNTDPEIYIGRRSYAAYRDANYLIETPEQVKLVSVAAAP